MQLIIKYLNLDIEMFIKIFENVAINDAIANDVRRWL